jgi:hypothetical protein
MTGMEIAGSLLNADDRDRLIAWRDVHANSFAGFQEDRELPASGFRTAGDFLFLSSDFHKRLTTELCVPLTEAEKGSIEKAAGGHTDVWARLVLLAAAEKDAKTST